MNGERVFMIVTFIVLISVIGIIFYTGSIIFPLATNIIDISIALEPVEPYDIAKLESVLDMNDTHWLVVVKYIDVDTNTTVYEELSYDLQSRSFVEDR